LFTRIADQFVADGAVQKVVAMYEKALKAKGDHEPALGPLTEIAI
jgi:hypothetical protein